MLHVRSASTCIYPASHVMTDQMLYTFHRFPECRAAVQVKLGTTWQILHGTTDLEMMRMLSSPRLPLQWMTAGALTALLYTLGRILSSE